MMTAKFTVLGEPRGKGRPRFSRHGNRTMTHTPAATVLYENLIATEYRRQCEDTRFPDGEPLNLIIYAAFAPPASASKKRREQMLAGEIRPTKKPDADNIMKVVADALNGVAYRDDAQIVVCTVAKYYSQTPRISVIIMADGKPAVFPTW